MVTFSEAREASRYALSKHIDSVDKLAEKVAKTIVRYVREELGESSISSDDKRKLASMVESVFGAYLAKKVYESMKSRKRKRRRKK